MLTFRVGSCHAVPIESAQVPFDPEAEIVPCPLELAGLRAEKR